MRPLAGKRPGARRFADALFGLGGAALARGARILTGPDVFAQPALEGTREGEPAADGAPVGAGSEGEAARRQAAAEEAAARLDAARDRLRATIAPPADDELVADDPPPAPHA